MKALYDWLVHGDGYQITSGPIIALGIFTYYRRHNCHVRRCPFLAWHPSEDGHPVCRFHHPHHRGPLSRIWRRLPLAVVMLLALASVAHAKWLAADHQDGCATTYSNPAVAIAYAREHGANVIRVVTTGPDWIWNDGSRHGSWSNVLACFRAAHAAGYRTYVSLQYARAIGARASPSHVRSYVAWVLAQIGRYVNWVSVGNEPYLSGTPPWLYRRVWPVTHAFLARHYRWIRDVFAEEATPWFIRWTYTGAKLIGFHCYDANHDLYRVPMLARWARSHGAALYCSEMAPDTYGTIGPGESLLSYENWVSWLRRYVPNLGMTSWYYWPAINPGL